MVRVYVTHCCPYCPTWRRARVRPTGLEFKRVRQAVIGMARMLAQAFAPNSRHLCALVLVELQFTVKCLILKLLSN